MLMAAQTAFELLDSGALLCRSTTLEREPSNHLTRPRDCPRSPDGRDGAIPACIHASRRSNLRGRTDQSCRLEIRSALPAHGRRGEEVAVKDVLEFAADLEVVPAFHTHPEVPAEAHRFGRLPLPADVVVERSRNTKLSGCGIYPGRRVQHLSGLRIEAFAVG